MFAYEARYYFPQPPVSSDYIKERDVPEEEKAFLYTVQKLSSYLTDVVRELGLYTLFTAEEKEDHFLISLASPCRLTDCLEIEAAINRFFQKRMSNEVRGSMQDLTEITFERLAQLLEEGYGYNGYGRDLMKQPDWNQIKEFLNGRVNDNFRFDEQISKATDFSRTEALQRAEELLAAPNAAEELKRIYAGGISKSGCRHPVHYFIETDSLEWGRDMANLLINALADNKRLQTRHVSYIHSIANMNSYKERYMRSIISCLSGSSVVIELAQGEKPETNKYWLANDLSFQKFLQEMVKKYSADTLFIFLSVGTEARQSCQPFIRKMEESIDIVQVSEGNRQTASARQYIGFLEQKNGIEPFTQEELSEVMTEDSYTPTALQSVFTKLCRMRRRSKDYPAYHSLKPVKLAEEEECGSGTAYERLQGMVGLAEVKKLAGRIIAMCQIQKLRREQGLGIGRRSLHMAFTGSPGSAKTTVARLLAEILFEKGVIARKRLVECGRADLVGKYVGWTAKLVKARFEEAKGGILFIDEAYSLVEEHAAFGKEAIDTIVQEMENHREDTIVIMAGYPDKMQGLLAANEGLRSRIACHVNFPDYNAKELVDILSVMAREHGYLLNQRIRRKCWQLFRKASQTPDFGNGRYVRNQLEDALAHQAERLLCMAEKKPVTKRMMLTLSCDDFQELSVGIASEKRREASGIGFMAASAGDSRKRG